MSGEKVEFCIMRDCYNDLYIEQRWIPLLPGLEIAVSRRHRFTTDSVLLSRFAVPAPETAVLISAQAAGRFPCSGSGGTSLFLPRCTALSLIRRRCSFCGKASHATVSRTGFSRFAVIFAI